MEGKQGGKFQGPLVGAGQQPVVVEFVRRHLAGRWPRELRRDRRRRGLARADPDCVQVERRQPVQPVAGVERRHSRIHHDQRRSEPDHEEQVAGDAQPAVEEH